jgi:phosphatidate cytidylyltransferase
MLGKRLISAAVLIPIVIATAIVGGWAIAGLVILLAGISAWEFWRMFKTGGFRPSVVLLVVGTIVIIFVRAYFSNDIFTGVLGFFILAAIAWHTYRYEKGIETSATDFCITAGGILYLGLLGSYIVSLRGIPETGLWWTLLSLPAIAFADTGAYFIGRAFGKHKMMPRVSPKKSWEGYLGGIIVSCILTPLLALLLHLYCAQVTWLKGLILAAVLAVLAPMGDFAESMLKRQFNIKDSSNLVPGHGGAFDRIDSYLWTGILAYYLITIFF